MKTNMTLAASVAAFSLLACMNAQVQNDDRAKHDAQSATVPTFHYLKASEIIGAKIYATATTDQLKTDKAFGEIKDIIVDTNSASGHGSFAVSSDGELFTVGSERMPGVACLRWDAKTRRFALDCPPMDTIALNASAKRMAEGHAEHRTARADDGMTTLGNARAASRLMMFSGVKGLKVYPQGSKEAFGKIDDLWIDTTRGCTGFFVVSSGGVLGVGDTSRLVPWVTTSVDRSVDLQDNQANVHATKEVLEAAPRVEGKTEANDTNLRTIACKIFGCEDPAKAAGSKDSRSEVDRVKGGEDAEKK